MKTPEGEELDEILERNYPSDFPRSERMPVRKIRKMMKSGRYAFFGFYEEGNLRAYASICTGREGCGVLIDYFAVCAPFRGRGYGTQALSLLASSLSGAPYLMLEIEDPDFADESSRERCLARIPFYRRAGFDLSGIKSKVFGVDFEIMTLQRSGSIPAEKTVRDYLGLYRLRFGPLVSALTVKIK